ncbi:IS1595 family transposase [Brevundimonas albigilva]|uniref:IS1595 family transposase n=1 Tax=Brevundimonas albigilva TaxID=1312364 RepID=A0ABY4SJI4_9CAUL|nr:IS1595 family transposase [Brevundimonas albigilva]URI15146.1 IS1595 family transposase [Brevundimonas albigilva]
MNEETKANRPISLQAFMRRFPDDVACADYLAAKRWPEGFRCPACPSEKGWKLTHRAAIWECAACHRQTSVTAGTIMHRTHLPLLTWFIASHLVATHSNGISALQLREQASIGSYKTAWFLLHRLRRAMVDPDRGGLVGVIETDETTIPFRTKDEPVAGGQGRSPIGKLVVVGGVEVHDDGSPGRIRLRAIPDFKRTTLHDFLTSVTLPGSLISTDGNIGYAGVPDRTVSAQVIGKMPAHVFMPWIHRVFSNLKRFGLGVYHGFRRAYLQAYLDEYCFRWNRRKWRHRSFDTLLGIGLRVGSLPYRTLVSKA